MSGIEMMSTEDIIEELRRRHDTVLFVAQRSMDVKTEERRCYWRGSTLTAIGLARYAEHNMHRYMDDAEDDVVEGET